MKVVLIRPKTATGDVSFISAQFPLNIASLASFLEKQAIKTEIWDFDVEPYDADILKTKINVYKPDLIGISCFTSNVKRGHAIASDVKKLNGNIPVVAGGVHISAVPEMALRQFPNFDYAVFGEGEYTFFELCKNIENNKAVRDIDGVAYRNGTGIAKGRARTIIKNLDELPYPARDKLKMHLYKGQSHRGFSRDFLKITEIITSRGCPNQCIFCASEITMGRGVRFRSAENIIEEIRECVERYGFNHFVFNDDTLTLNHRRLLALCKYLRDFKITWSCNARVWPLTKEVLKAMAESGCTGITYGVESGSPRILGLINKNITIEQIRQAFRWSREAGIRLIEADFIIGSHPSETLADVEMTIKLVKEIKPDIIMPAIIVPYPGTRLYQIFLENGYLKGDEDWDNFLLYGKKPVWRTDNFLPGDLVKIQKDILRKFYFSVPYMMKRLSSIRNLHELKYWVGSGAAFLRDAIINKNGKRI